MEAAARDAASKLERTLRAAVAQADTTEGPPQLAAAMRAAVFPGGARVRPKLCLAVADACGGDAPVAALMAAAAIELLHCASLVHDDLPCFDDAATRRGLPSVHRAYGVPVALLAGDALIVLAFETLARAGGRQPERLPRLLAQIAHAVGAPHGLCAGQAWESERAPRLEAYHQAKTAALFIAATMAGATAAGADPAPWRALGERLGAAYQVADDLCDALGDAEESGKEPGRDAALGRPCAVAELGVAGAVARLEAEVEAAVASIPPCRGEAALRKLVRLQATRLTPKSLAVSAA